MHIAKVIGDVAGSEKPTSMNGKKLLIIQPLDQQKRPDGKPMVAVDTIGAGIGEHVFYVKGQDPSSPFFQGSRPVDAGIVGIIEYFNPGDGQNK